MTALVLAACILTTALLTWSATAFGTAFAASRRRGYVGRHRATW